MRRRALLISGNKPNTFIGGVASMFPTKGDLATFLGISSNDIKVYAVVGSDIECHIKVNYTLGADAFKNNKDITYYDDQDGKCTSFSGASQFENSSIVWARFPRDISISETVISTFKDCKDLETLWLDTLKILRTSACQGCSKLENVYAPMLQFLGEFSFYNSGSGTSPFQNWDLRQISGQAFYRGRFDFDVTKAIFFTNAGRHVQESYLSIANFNAITSTIEQRQDGSVVVMPKCTTLKLNNASELIWRLSDMTALELLEIKKVTTWGSVSERDSRLDNLPVNIVKVLPLPSLPNRIMRVHEDMMTANSGSPHVCVEYALERGWFVEWFDSSGVKQGDEVREIIMDVQNDLWHHLKTLEPPADTLKDECIISGASWGLAGTTADISFPAGGGIKNSGTGMVRCDSALLGSPCDQNGDISFSFVMRFNLDAWSSGALVTLAAKSPSATARTEYYIEINKSTGNIHMRLFSGDDNNRRELVIPAGVTTSVDYHVVIQYDGMTYEAYVNNTKLTVSVTDTGTYNGMTPSPALLTLFSIADSTTYVSYSMQGTHKDFRLYRYRALTAQEVGTLYNGDENTQV